MSNYSSYIPAYYIGTPGNPGGSIPVNQDTKVYSSYTGNLISVGPVSKGTKCDAKEGNKNHGKNFHSINIDSNGNFMMHRARRP
jgi:hypothetical protein